MAGPPIFQGVTRVAFGPLAFLRSARTRANGGKDGLYEGGFQNWRSAMGVE
jgi:hypothetical protein